MGTLKIGHLMKLCRAAIGIFPCILFFGAEPLPAQITPLNLNTSTIGILPGVAGGVFQQDSYVYVGYNVYDDDGHFVVPFVDFFRDGTNLGDSGYLIPGVPGQLGIPLGIPLISYGTVNSEFHVGLSNDNRLFFVSTLTAQGALEANLSSAGVNFNGVTSALLSGTVANLWLSATDGSVFRYTFTVSDGALTPGALENESRDIGAGRVLGDYYFTDGASTPNFLASAGSTLFDLRSDGSILRYELPTDWAELGFTITDVALEKHVGLSSASTQAWITGVDTNMFPNGLYLQGSICRSRQFRSLH